MRCVCALMSFLLGGPVALVAQTPEPPLFGRVTDQTGRILPGVSIHVTSTDRTSTEIAVTDQDGRYAFRTLPAGQYTVTYSDMNFAAVRRRNDTVTPGPLTRMGVTVQRPNSRAVRVAA